jgi:hypothetical protein
MNSNHLVRRALAKTFSTRGMSVLSLPNKVATTTSTRMMKLSTPQATSNSFPSHNAHVSTQTRSLQVNRAFPQYSIMGEKCLMTIKPILPTFKSVANGDGISVQQKGRMLLEFAPTNPGNKPGFQWDEKIGFALSVDEMGLLISQLPHYGVTLVRKVGGDQSNGFGGGSYNLVSSSTTESMDKVLTAQPGEGATITFRVDYMKDGVGGQIAPAAATSETSHAAPLEVLVEAGDWEVVLAIFRESIPYLLGWNKMMDIATENAIANRDA